MQIFKAQFLWILYGFIFLFTACRNGNDPIQRTSSFISESAITELYHNQLIGIADSIMQLPALALVNSALHQDSDTPGTYVSLACYWWPNPTTQDGLPYIRIDGNVNPETRSDASHLPILINMARRIEYLANAYLLTGSEKYAGKALEQLYTWFINEETKMLPHLENAQMVKGVNTGRSYGIIDGWWLVRVAESIRPLTVSAHWNHELETGLISWFSEFLNWLIDSEFGQTEIRSGNNHGTWYDVQVVAYAMLTGRTDFAERHLQEISTVRLRRQLSPSGRQKLEMRRTRPLHYAIYNLAGQMKLAQYARTLDVDYGNKATFFSSGLERSVLYLIHTMNGADVTALTDPHDETNTDLLYLNILDTACKLFEHDEICTEKTRYLSEQITD